MALLMDSSSRSTASIVFSDLSAETPLFFLTDLFTNRPLLLAVFFLDSLTATAHLSSSSRAAFRVFLA